ncbi:hypothetical protein [Streptomyces sp. NPDC014685]|uniref:hypothetical protein n=1 Tax=Streptomyces sp. NPDC014685 TaxID=3364881 RepID=UPI0036FCCDB2
MERGPVGQTGHGRRDPDTPGRGPPLWRSGGRRGDERGGAGRVATTHPMHDGVGQYGLDVPPAVGPGFPGHRERDLGAGMAPEEAAALARTPTAH